MKNLKYILCLATIAFTSSSAILSQCLSYDLDENYIVNTTDFLLFLPDFGSTCSGVCPTDFDANGVTDNADFLLFLPSFGSECTSGSFTDSRDGNTYEWVKIGNQLWMSENLAYLPSVSPSTNGSNSDPVYFVYDYQGTDVAEAKATSNYSTYGAMYNWPAAMNACPNGWHLPSDAEWEELAIYISNDNGGYEKSDTEWAEIGNHLKTSYGWGGGGNGIDNYNFHALPGGLRNSTHYFDRAGFITNFWSTAETNGTLAWARGMNSNYSEFYIFEFFKEYGFSVRCIKD